MKAKVGDLVLLKAKPLLDVPESCYGILLEIRESKWSVDFVHVTILSYRMFSTVVRKKKWKEYLEVVQ